MAQQPSENILAAPKTELLPSHTPTLQVQAPVQLSPAHQQMGLSLVPGAQGNVTTPLQENTRQSLPEVDNLAAGFVSSPQFKNLTKKAQEEALDSFYNEVAMPAYGAKGITPLERDIYFPVIKSREELEPGALARFGVGTAHGVNKALAGTINLPFHIIDGGLKVIAGLAQDQLGDDSKIAAWAKEQRKETHRITEGVTSSVMDSTQSWFDDYGEPTTLGGTVAQYGGEMLGMTPALIRGGELLKGVPALGRAAEAKAVLPRVLFRSVEGATGAYQVNEPEQAASWAAMGGALPVAGAGIKSIWGGIWASGGKPLIKSTVKAVTQRLATPKQLRAAPKTAEEAAAAVLTNHVEATAEATKKPVEEVLAQTSKEAIEAITNPDPKVVEEKAVTAYDAIANSSLQAQKSAARAEAAAKLAGVKTPKEVLAEESAKEVQRVTADTQIAGKKVVIDVLPQDLAGAKPRYKEAKLGFESDVDKALYIVANPTTKSARHEDYMAFLRSVFPGEEDADILQVARAIRKQVGQHVNAVGSVDGEVVVPRFHGAAKAPKVEAPAVEAPKVESQVEIPAKETPKLEVKEEAPKTIAKEAPAPKVELKAEPKETVPETPATISKQVKDTANGTKKATVIKKAGKDAKSAKEAATKIVKEAAPEAEVTVVGTKSGDAIITTPENANAAKQAAIRDDADSLLQHPATKAQVAEAVKAGEAPVVVVATEPITGAEVNAAVASTSTAVETAEKLAAEHPTARVEIKPATAADEVTKQRALANLRGSFNHIKNQEGLKAMMGDMNFVPNDESLKIFMQRKNELINTWGQEEAAKIIEAEEALRIKNKQELFELWQKENPGVAPKAKAPETAEPKKKLATKAATEAQEIKEEAGAKARKAEAQKAVVATIQIEAKTAFGKSGYGDIEHQILEAFGFKSSKDVTPDALPRIRQAIMAASLKLNPFIQATEKTFNELPAGIDVGVDKFMVEANKVFDRDTKFSQEIIAEIALEHPELVQDLGASQVQQAISRLEGKLGDEGIREWMRKQGYDVIRWGDKRNSADEFFNIEVLNPDVVKSYGVAAAENLTQAAKAVGVPAQVAEKAQEAAKAVAKVATREKRAAAGNSAVEALAKATQEAKRPFEIEGSILRHDTRGNPMGYYKDGVRTHTADGVRIGGKVKVAHDSGAGGSAEELARQEAGWVHYSVGSGEPGFLGLKVDVPEGRAAIAINKVTGKMRVATNNMNKPDAQILNLWGGKVKAKLGAK